MIIKITVHDNNFDYILGNYIEGFKDYSSLLCDKKANIKKSDESAMIEYLRLENKIKNLLNPKFNITLTKEDKLFLEERIRTAFTWFIKGIKPDIYKYLCENLEVTFPKSFIDKRENGEAYYWFQQSGTIVKQ